MKSENEVCHNGRIKSIDGHKIEVVILSRSACSSCHSKSMCSMTEMKEKSIDIYNFKENKHKVGDEVEVVMSLTMGNKALLLGYGIPFILLLSSVIITFNVSNSEATTGIVTLIVLASYYLLLAAFRKQISKTFSFQIK